MASLECALIATPHFAAGSDDFLLNAKPGLALQKYERSCSHVVTFGEIAIGTRITPVKSPAGAVGHAAGGRVFFERQWPSIPPRTGLASAKFQTDTSALRLDLGGAAGGRTILQTPKTVMIPVKVPKRIPLKVLAFIDGCRPDEVGKRSEQLQQSSVEATLKSRESHRMRKSFSLRTNSRR